MEWFCVHGNGFQRDSRHRERVAFRAPINLYGGAGRGKVHQSYWKLRRCVLGNGHKYALHLYGHKHLDRGLYSLHLSASAAIWNGTYVLGSYCSGEPDSYRSVIFERAMGSSMVRCGTA